VGAEVQGSAEEVVQRWNRGETEVEQRWNRGGTEVEQRWNRGGAGAKVQMLYLAYATQSILTKPLLVSGDLHFF
jgi:hypothetical protein